jgi:hypothetical protein
MQKDVLDFIVIGGEKCGTTSLNEYLRKHPELYLSPGKGGNYFNSDAKYAQPWAEYLRQELHNADPSLKWGTVSAMYMSSVGSDGLKVPSRIHKQLPEVRLIAILRDPLERARSQHLMAVYEDWGETRSFDEAISELLEPEALVAARHEPRETTGYVVFGEYGRVLSNYLQLFPREQLLVVFTGELAANPQSVLRRIFEFIEVDPDFVPDNLGVRYLQGSRSRRLNWLNLYQWQMTVSSVPFLRSAWHALPRSARIRIDTHFRTLELRARLWNRRAGTGGQDQQAAGRTSETNRRLAEHYRADAEVLSQLIGVTPPWMSRLERLASEEPRVVSA